MEGREKRWIRGGGGLPAYFSLGKYKIQCDDIVRLFLNCQPEDIRSKVIVSPDWDADFLSEAAEKITTVSEGRVYDVLHHGQEISFLHCSTPSTGDLTLALSCTACRRLIFTGSYCGLSENMKIGDIMVITESIGGDGYTKYLENGEISPRLFLTPTSPHRDFNNLLEEYATFGAIEGSISLHKGKVFSSDSVIAEMAHLEQITGKFGCTGLEMETSAVFNAATVTGMQAAALLLASDIRTAGKSFPGDQSDSEKEKYRHIMHSVLSKIILNVLCDERLPAI